MYDAEAPLMEINESSMQDLHTLQMSAGHHQDLYHEPLESYSDSLGVSSNNVYEHGVSTGADVLVHEIPSDMLFMAHTSQEFA